MKFFTLLFLSGFLFISTANAQTTKTSKTVTKDGVTKKNVVRQNADGSTSVKVGRKDEKGNKEAAGKKKEADENDIVVRAAVSTEYFKVIGWDDMQWVGVLKDEGEDLTTQGRHKWNELISNFAGNAWSAFHFIPIRLATMATIGRFGVGDADQDDADKKEAAADEEDKDADTISSSDSGD